MLLLVVAPAFADTAGEQAARKFADSVGSQVLAIINNSSASEKQQKLQQLFVQDVDITWIGQFVMGRGWQQATPEQRNNNATLLSDAIGVRTVAASTVTAASLTQQSPEITAAASASL